jgi:hypothetical protein
VVLSVRTVNNCLHFRYFVIIECDMSTELYQRIMDIHQFRAFFGATTDIEDFEPLSKSLILSPCGSM